MILHAIPYKQEKYIIKRLLKIELILCELLDRKLSYSISKRRKIKYTQEIKKTCK